MAIVARKPIADLDEYRRLLCRLDPTAGALQSIFERVSTNNKRIVLLRGAKRRIRAALRNAGYGDPSFLAESIGLKRQLTDWALMGLKIAHH